MSHYSKEIHANGHVNKKRTTGRKRVCGLGVHMRMQLWPVGESGMDSLQGEIKSLLVSI